METIQNIETLKKRYIDELYQKTREQQKIDKTYIDDTFLPGVRHPHKVLRLGLGDEIVNAPAEQIVTSNPQALVECKNKEAELRISKVLNGWLDILRRQNPNCFKETVKNKLGRGENYIKLAHNESWVTSPIGRDKKGFPIFDRRGLPMLFLILDPMVIYGSPEEDENGIPHRVIVFYERQPLEVITRYPYWVRPSDKGKNKPVDWLEFWDKNTKHFEADGVIVERTSNPYGFVPFVRKYSGFGRRSPEGELANLIVGDIKHSRGYIDEICVMESDIASSLHLTAHQSMTIISSGSLNKGNIEANLALGAYDLNVISNVPEGTRFLSQKDLGFEQPTQEAYVHLAGLKADLRQRHPFIMAGFPWGASGRQQGMTNVAAMRRYDTVVENTETEWATALEMAFKIMKAIPTMLPDGLHKADLDIPFKCIVKLKAKDPIEEDRLITLGDRLRKLPNPAVDLGTFHTEFLGYTQGKSKEVMAKMLADMVTIYNPDVAAVMGMVAAEESGMERWLEMARERRQRLEKQQQGLEQAPPPTTQQRVQGEVETPLGREYPVEGTRGARIPPERYTRRA